MERNCVKKRKSRCYKKNKANITQKQTRLLMVCTTVTVLCLLTLLLFCSPQKSVYRTLRSDGYTETQELLIASIVGDPDASDKSRSERSAGYGRTVEYGFAEVITIHSRIHAFHSTKQAITDHLFSCKL